MAVTRSTEGAAVDESEASIELRLEEAKTTAEQALASVTQLEATLAKVKAAGADATAFLKACVSNKGVKQFLSRYPGTLPSAWLKGESRQCAFTALQCAGVYGNVELAQRLLESGAEVDKATSTDSTTPLLLACWSNRLEVATLLLDYGADASKVVGNGETPLSYTCSDGFEELATLLILKGAKYGKAIETNAALPGSGRTYVRAQEAANATHIATIAAKDAENAALRAELAEIRGDGDAVSSKASDVSASDAAVARFEAEDALSPRE